MTYFCEFSNADAKETAFSIDVMLWILQWCRQSQQLCVEISRDFMWSFVQARKYKHQN